MGIEWDRKGNWNWMVNIALGDSLNLTEWTLEYKMNIKISFIENINEFSEKKKKTIFLSK